jgi:hypothetical protein
MTTDTIQSIQIDGVTHRVTGRQTIRHVCRLSMGCGLTMDCEPAWVQQPPEQFDELGTPVPWTIVFSEDPAHDCPSC